MAPSGPIRPALLDEGLEYLRRKGYQVAEGRHIRCRRGYMAGSDAQRTADLNRAISDPDLDAVVFARGGYGCGRILEDLDFSPLKLRPKIFLGYSDATAFHAALFRATGIAGFYGPMVLNYNHPGREFRERTLWSVLERRPGWNRFRLSRRGTLRGGSGEGRLVGGCLSLLISLLGTPFDVDTRGAILFWEDVDEEPYRIDRMLNQLRMAGKFRDLRGMVVGRLLGCTPKGKTPGLPLPEILSDHLRGTRFPVLLDFPAGHAPGMATLPLGLPARLDTAARLLEILP